MKDEEKTKHLPSRLAAIAVPAFIAIIASLAIFDIRVVFEPPLLLFILNTVFLSAIPFAVTYISARGYLTSGSLSLLFLGCGTLAIGSGALVAGCLIGPPGGPNVAVTIHNTGALFGSIFHLASAALTSARVTSERAPNRGKLKVILACLGILVFTALLTIASLQGAIPPFFTQGVGPTLLRQAVLGTSVALFAISSLLFMRVYFRSKSGLPYWYSLAVALIAVGLSAVFLQKAVGSPIGWAGRSAQYLGGIYFLIAVLSAIRDARAKGIPLERTMAGFFRDAEELYRALVETVTDAMISIDHEGRVLLWNSAAEKMFGYSRGEAVDSLLIDLIVPDKYADSLRQEMENLTKTGKSPPIGKATEIEARRRDGEVFPIELSVSARKTADGWTGTIIIRDITERKRAEEALKESEQRYRQLFEGVGDAMMVFSSQGEFLDCNEAALQRLAYSREEFARLGAADIVHPDFHLLMKENQKRIWAGETTTVESAHRCKDGRVIPVEVNARRIEYQGELAILAVVRDITMRKRAEEEIQGLAKFPSENPNPVLRVAKDGTILYANNSSFPLLNVWGCQIGQLLPDHLRQSILDVLDSGLSKDVEVTWEDRIFSFAFAPVVDAGYVNVYGLDITERKKAGQALKEHSERLEEMVEERTKELRDAQEELIRKERLAILGQLAGGVGHELRNPLGVISNAIYYLQATLPDADETTTEYLEMISAEVRNSEKIVSDLLDLSRTRLPEREETAVSELVARLLEKQPPPEKVKVTAEIAPDLPPLFVDPRQIEQVLTNLVANAYEAMPEGGKLTIKARRKKDQVHISVTDTGCGISKENMKKLFQPLFTTKARGIGLGLAVSKNLVEANGGSIEVESQEGKGSTFTLILPTKEAQV